MTCGTRHSTQKYDHQWSSSLVFSIARRSSVLDCYLRRIKFPPRLQSIVSRGSNVEPPGGHTQLARTGSVAGSVCSRTEHLGTSFWGRSGGLPAVDSDRSKYGLFGFRFVKRGRSSGLGTTVCLCRSSTNVAYLNHRLCRSWRLGFQGRDQPLRSFGSTDGSWNRNWNSCKAGKLLVLHLDQKRTCRFPQL